MIADDRPSKFSLDNTLALLADCVKAGRLAGDIERLKAGTSTVLPALEQEHAAVVARITQAVGTGKKRRTS